jgi:hypothetical protein
MKVCPTCKNQYPDDANFCPREECAGTGGPQKLQPLVPEEPAARFVPLSHIGGLASGEVWQASDTRTGQAVAYKLVVAAAFPTTILVDRCLRELKQLQRANNPRLVKVVDFGKTAAGTVFVASELVSGDPLDERIRNFGPVPIDTAKRIIAQIGEALLEGQKVGVVHRDLSPKNVLVDADDVVKVINFAVPRPLSETVTGVPEYMSPEQAEGKLIDQRSNTYSLGAILYLLLTGEPPVGGATPSAVLEAIPKVDIIPPSIRRGGGLGAEVDRVVLKALEKNSSRRPLTMRQFLSDVAALIATGEARAPAESTPAGGDANAGFARTMMFAGGTAEVQKLVSQAMAARQAVVDEAAVQAVPRPEDAPTGSSAAQRPRAATPAALTPSPRLPLSPDEPSSTPVPPSTTAHAAQATGPGAAIPPGAAGREAEASSGSNNFRETLWFKKGDVDQMVAEARAKLAAPGPAAGPTEVPAAAVEPGKPVPSADSGPTNVAEAKPLEDRYLDDGTVTVDDREKFSLRSGGTAAALNARGGAAPGGTVPGGPVPGERMSDDEVLGEIGGGKRFMIMGIVAAAVLAVAAVVWLAMGGRGFRTDKRDDNTVGGNAVVPALVAPRVPDAPQAAPPPASVPVRPAAPAPSKPTAAEKVESSAAAEAGATEANPRPSVRKKSVTAAKKKSTQAKHSAPAVQKHH